MPSAKEVDTTIQPVLDNAPAAPEVSINSASVTSVPPTTGDEPLNTAALMTLQPPPSKDSPPAADSEMINIPQEPVPPSTSPDITPAKDGCDAGSSDLQPPNTPPPGDGAPTKTRQQSTPSQDDPDATFEADKQLGVVNATPLQIKNVRALPISTDSTPAHPPKQSSDRINALKAHTSGLNEPEIDSLLELIQKDDDFEEESKPHRIKLAEAIVAVRDASQSEDWSNLLRGVIILTICLEFPNGDVSETCT